MKYAIILLVVLAGAVCWAQDKPVPTDTIQRITVSQINDHLYTITCVGGEEFNLPPFATNLVASIGPDGILLVDAGFNATGPALADTLKKLGDLKIVINTHSHGDHTFGNRYLKDQAALIAHRSVVERLAGNYFHLTGAPSPNQPAVGFDDSLLIVFNGEEVRVVHTPSCHSGGDAYVYFTGSNVVVVGDLFFPDELPYVDLPGRGSVKGYHQQIKNFIQEFPDDAVFIAAHGREYNTDDLREYDEMLAGTVAAVKQAVAKGTPSEEMNGDIILEEWADWNGSFATTTLQAWTQTIQTELAGIDWKPSVCEPLTAVLIDGTVREAAAEYGRLKATEADTYDFGEAHLNMLGYQLLMRGRVEDAVGIFKLNMEAFPTSFNVYDSYAEALMTRGDTSGAITNYEKSLELNAENTNAVEMLKRLRKE